MVLPGCYLSWREFCVSFPIRRIPGFSFFGRLGMWSGHRFFRSLPWVLVWCLIHTPTHSLCSKERCYLYCFPVDLLNPVMETSQSLRDWCFNLLIHTFDRPWHWHRSWTAAWLSNANERMYSTCGCIRITNTSVIWSRSAFPFVFEYKCKRWRKMALNK